MLRSAETRRPGFTSLHVCYTAPPGYPEVPSQDPPRTPERKRGRERVRPHPLMMALMFWLTFKTRL